VLSSSPFFGIRSPHILADRLSLGSLADLERLVEAADGNFRQYQDGRWIETPLPKLKSVQRRIHQLLTRTPPPPYLQSAYKNRSAVRNAESHDGGKPMVRLDIRRFYPSSDGFLVYRFFHEKLRCAPHVAKMLTILCTIGPSNNSRRRHLPTGGVTSPILAFFAYQDMFEELSELAAQNGLTFSVLADDITFSGEGADHGILRKAREIIPRYGLVSNRKKERVWSRAHSNKRVTGVLVTPKGPRVPWERKKAILALRQQLPNEIDIKKRTKTYQRYVGALSSAGQIEERFGVGAQFALAEWRKDKDAWDAHVRASGAKRRH
jgi:RNA-directed DNA polymerase